MIRKTVLALVAGAALIAAVAPASAGYGYGYGYSSYRSSYDCYTPSYSYGYGYRSSYGY